MTKEQIRAAVIDALRATIHERRSDVGEDLNLVDDLAIDSFQAVEVVAAIEARLARSTPPGSERRFADAKTVGDLIVAAQFVFMGTESLSAGLPLPLRTPAPFHTDLSAIATGRRAVGRILFALSVLTCGAAAVGSLVRPRSASGRQVRAGGASSAETSVAAERAPPTVRQSTALPRRRTMVPQTDRLIARPGPVVRSADNSAPVGILDGPPVEVAKIEWKMQDADAEWTENVRGVISTVLFDLDGGIAPQCQVDCRATWCRVGVPLNATVQRHALEKAAADMNWTLSMELVTTDTGAFSVAYVKR